LLCLNGQNVFLDLKKFEGAEKHLDVQQENCKHLIHVQIESFWSCTLIIIPILT